MKDCERKQSREIKQIIESQVFKKEERHRLANGCLMVFKCNIFPLYWELKGSLVLCVEKMTV